MKNANIFQPFLVRVIVTKDGLDEEDYFDEEKEFYQKLISARAVIRKETNEAVYIGNAAVNAKTAAQYWICENGKIKKRK